MTLLLATLLFGGLAVRSAIENRPILDVLRGIMDSVPGGPGERGFQASILGPLGGGGGSPADTAQRPAGPGGKTNPVPGFQSGRIDQGVDFAPTREGQPIYAPAAGTIVKTGAPGWPGGGGVLLHTTGGEYIFFYESLTPTVHAGQRVSAGDVIARAHTGGTGIEIGFADRNGVPLAHAGYTEGKVTGWGRRMATYLKALGVKGIG